MTNLFWIAWLYCGLPTTDVLQASSEWNGAAFVWRDIEPASYWIWLRTNEQPHWIYAVEPTNKWTFYRVKREIMKTQKEIDAQMAQTEAGLCSEAEVMKEQINLDGIKILLDQSAMPDLVKAALWADITANKHRWIVIEGYGRFVPALYHGPVNLPGRKEQAIIFTPVLPIMYYQPWMPWLDYDLALQGYTWRFLNE